jgi:glutathione S-transferase
MEIAMNRQQTMVASAGHVAKRITLVSHSLCPYVQRAAIVLAEKRVDFDRKDIDLANKPAWFLKISPLGKTPVLVVDDQSIFESAVICEYLDETHLPRLHPEDALARAQHRAWMEFGSSILNAIASFYNAADERAMTAKSAEITAKFEQVEAALADGPYFAGERFSIVDAVFAPIFRYFDVFETIADLDWFANTPRVCAWRRNLAMRESVRTAVVVDYPELLKAFLRKRNSALSVRMAA